MRESQRSARVLSHPMSVSDLADPRLSPPGASHPRAPYDDAQQAIEAATAAEADRSDARARHWLEAALAAADGGLLAKTLDRAPSPEIARHLNRLLADIERVAPTTAGDLRTTLFAIPIVLVVARDAGATGATHDATAMALDAAAMALDATAMALDATAVTHDATGPARDADTDGGTLDAIVRDASALGVILRDARAFAGCETFALSPSLVATDAIDVRALPALLARRALAPPGGDFASAALDLPPAPIRVEAGFERAHLRFIVGAILTPPHADPLAVSTIGRWGMPFARALGKTLAVPGVSLLALPRPAQGLVSAVQSGRAAQREVSAQLFASNAIRALRASFGEPTAIVSAHRAPDAPGGGELRLSLSSPFAPKAAQGFRCPLYPYETVLEVGAMLASLLRDCRVSDVRFMPGVHDDVDPTTRGPLFFKDHGGASHSSLH